MKFRLDVSTYFLLLCWIFTNLFIFADLFRLSFGVFSCIISLSVLYFLSFFLELLFGCWIVWIDHLSFIFYIFLMSFCFTFSGKLPWILSSLLQKKKKKINGASGWLSPLSIQLLVSAQVMISGFLSLSPACIGLCADSVKPAWDSISLVLCPSPTCSLSLSKIKK